MDNRPIGVFDSGLGGLTVVREIQKQLPDESVVFIGDTARTPYGSKDPETLLTFGLELINFLKDRSVKAVVIACGTISSNGADILKDEHSDIPLFDVITPGVMACAEEAPARVGFIATEASVRSGLFAKLLKKRCPGTKINMRACPLFVPMTEEGWINNVVTQIVAETYLEDWRGQIDALVLGCTHYPLLTGVISSVLEGVKIIDMADYTVRQLKKVLDENGMKNSGTEPPSYQLYTTGYTDKFEKMAGLVLKKGYEVRKGVV